MSGSLLIVAGGYVAWYGTWELRVLRGGTGADPVVGAAAGLQQWLDSHIAAVGAGGFLAVLAVLLGLDLITRRRSPRAPHQAEAPPGSAETERREPDEERA